MVLGQGGLRVLAADETRSRGGQAMVEGRLLFRIAAPSCISTSATLWEADEA